MKIVDHRVTVSEYPVNYESVEFVRDDETGRKVKDEHGHYVTRPIKEVRNHRYIQQFRFLVDRENGDDPEWMPEPALVNTFGKKTVRHVRRAYVQSVIERQKTAQEEQE